MKDCRQYLQMKKVMRAARVCEIQMARKHTAKPRYGPRILPKEKLVNSVRKL